MFGQIKKKKKTIEYAIKCFGSNHFKIIFFPGKDKCDFSTVWPVNVYNVG